METETNPLNEFHRIIVKEGSYDKPIFKKYFDFHADADEVKPEDVEILLCYFKFQRSLGVNHDLHLDNTLPVVAQVRVRRVPFPGSIWSSIFPKHGEVNPLGFLIIRYHGWYQLADVLNNKLVTGRLRKISEFSYGRASFVTEHNKICVINSEAKITFR